MLAIGHYRYALQRNDAISSSHDFRGLLDHRFTSPDLTHDGLLYSPTTIACVFIDTAFTHSGVTELCFAYSMTMSGKPYG